MECAAAERHKGKRRTAEAERFAAGQRAGCKDSLLTEVAKLLRGAGQQHKAVFLGIVDDYSLPGTQGGIGTQGDRRSGVIQPEKAAADAKAQVAAWKAAKKAAEDAKKAAEEAKKEAVK